MACQPHRLERARQLRREQTKAEALLWSQLRDRRLAGFKFRRQVTIGPYFADFACVHCKVIVEVDGELHEGREKYDEQRTAYLAGEGWVVVRFWNSDVYDEMDRVLAKITAVCQERGKQAGAKG